jgi:cytochrome c-type biogenesis protein CcmH/NrfG
LIWVALVAVVFVAGGAWLIAKSMQTRLIVLGLGIAGVAAYWVYGRPDMSDQPLEARMETIDALIRTNPESLSEQQVIAVAERQARKEPEAAMPLIMIARMYESLAQKEQAEGMALIQGGNEQGAAEKAAAMQESLTRAEESYREALRRDPRNAEAAGEMADLRFKTTGEVDATTTQLYQMAFAARPDQLRIGYLAGIGLWLQGKKEEAEALWADIDARTPADGPQRQMFAALRQMFGVDSPPSP